MNTIRFQAPSIGVSARVSRPLQKQPLQNQSLEPASEQQAAFAIAVKDTFQKAEPAKLPSVAASVTFQGGPKGRDYISARSVKRQWFTVYLQSVGKTSFSQLSPEERRAWNDLWRNMAKDLRGQGHALTPTHSDNES